MSIIIDTYSKEFLIEQYNLHKSYVLGRLNGMSKSNINIRLPSIPEDISENIIKFIIQNKNNDITSTWNCGVGDLYSQIEGVQECKCFTSDGPLSFTPSSLWNVIYFLDARDWLNNNFKLYKLNISNASEEWKNIKVNKKETFDDQAKQGRRPRLNWNDIQKQLSSYMTLIYEGTFEDIFIPFVIID